MGFSPFVRFTFRFHLRIERLDFFFLIVFAGSGSVADS